MINTFDMYGIDIGPTNSNTVDLMRTAFYFSTLLEQKKVLSQVSHVKTDLFGSIAQASISQSNGKAILLGLAGFEPETIDPAIIDSFLLQVESTQRLPLLGVHDSSFPTKNAISFHHKKTISTNENAIEISAYNGDELLLSQIYYSDDDTFIINRQEMDSFETSQED